LRGLERLELPIAHGEGRVVALPERLSDLLPLAPLRYCANPNGSISAIAGVCNTAGNVFGLMPHPERYVSPYQHPDWHRLRRLEEPRVTGEDSRAKPNGSDPASYGRIAYAPRMAYAPHPAQGTPALESRECEPTGLALFRNAVRYVQEEL
jgi:phosphoribosylformylglycinamidine (FGAM) synthase-like amidotransferase family enzyme